MDEPEEEFVDDDETPTIVEVPGDHTIKVMRIKRRLSGSLDRVESEIRDVVKKAESVPPDPEDEDESTCHPFED